MNTQRIRYFLSTTALVSVAALSLAPAGWAEDENTTSNWTGKFDDTFNYFENWDNGFNGADLVIDGEGAVVSSKGVTVAADYGSNPTIPNVGPRTVTISGGATLNATSDENAVLAIGWSRGETESTVTVTGEGSRLYTAGSWSRIGFQDGTTGVLYVKDGGTYDAGYHVAIGRGEGATGRIDVDNGKLKSAEGAELILGYGANSTGQVDLKNGSTATLNGGVYLGKSSGSRSNFNILSGSSATTSGEVTVGEGSDLTASFTVQGAGSSYTANGVFLMGAGNSSEAGFNILEGAEATTNDTVTVGQGAGSAGYVTVDGQGSTYTSNGAFRLGQGTGSTGTLTVSNAAEASFKEGLSVGEDGTGAISVQSGGKATSEGDVILGVNSEGGSGKLSVAGAGSSFTLKDSNLVIGSKAPKSGSNDYPGYVAVSDGGTLTLQGADSDLSLGDAAQSYGLLQVSGKDASATVGGDLSAGISGTATIIIMNDALLTVDGKTYLARGEGSTGNWTVYDADVVLNDETYIGYGGQGDMTITAGGTVTANDAVSLGHDAGEGDEYGVIRISGVGSSLEMTESLLTVGHDSAGVSGLRLGFGGASTSYPAEGGIVWISEGGAASVGDLSVGQEQGATGTVAVVGAGTDGDENTVASSLKVADNATVGNRGRGSLLALDGSSVEIGGDLTVGAASSGNGIMRVNNGATVSVGTDDGEGNYDGTVTVARDSGSTGTLVIGASYDVEEENGGAVASGRVNAGRLAFGTGTGSLVFNITDTDYSFGMDVTGGGAINAYNGTISLSGDYSGYYGNTNIHGGTVAVDTDTFVNSAVTVMAGATLAGSGSLSDVTLQDGSTVAPGGAGIGTLTIAGGDLSFADGASYAVTVSSDGTSDLLAVKSTDEGQYSSLVPDEPGTIGGAVTLGGSSSLKVSRLASDDEADFSLNTWYTIMTADQGITGEFSEVSDTFAYLDTTLDYDNDTEVLLALTRNDVDFEDVVSSSNSNARNTARAIGTMDEENPLYKKVLFLEDGEIDRTYQALSGETHASMSTAMLQSTEPTRRLVVNRMRQITPGAATPAAVTRNATSYETAGSFFSNPEVWGQAYGSWSKLDGSDGASGMEATTGGFVIGADAETDGGWRTGVFGSFGLVDTDAKDSSADSDADSYQLGVYTARSFGQMALRMGASYTWDDVSAKRNVSVGGVRQDLEADYWARTAQAFVELGYQTSAGRTSLEPFIGQAILYQEIDSFTETGGSAALSVDGEDLTQGITTVGLRFGRDLEGIGAGMSNLHGGVAWQHVSGDLNAESTMRFASGSDAFSVTGSALDRNQAVLSLGLRTELTERSVLDIGYQGTLSENSQSHAIQATYSVRF
ncbi:autotransporter domain-containing protein [Rhodovulum sp. MB263]|uniref:autotransporter domain-containing protein n=1 Tax=Rhodovulum sp. (strain MB263) TaxID=308754 RepID=UPI0009B75C84|nr:autotransporter domain-containing protein [Rhodovulum sp. MB263]ARC90678.1 hypothetical protein B5V46_18530 [Rhodovulum sp. MB263]